MDLFLPAVRRASGDGARIKELSRCGRASELGLACSSRVGNDPADPVDRRRQLPAPAGFYWRVAGTRPAGGSGKSRLSGCELVPRRGHVRDGRPLIGLIGARSPRFSRQFAVIGIAAVCITALVYT